MTAPRRVPTVAAVTALLLALAGSSIEAARGAAGSAAADDPKREFHFEVDVSYATALFVWIDNLSGMSPGKTRDGYVQAWRAKHGPPSSEDRAMLARWRTLRRPPATAEVAIPAPAANACAPAQSEAPNAGQRLLVVALEATRVDDIVAAATWLAPEERADLAAVLAHFEPRFQPIWERMGHARAFREPLLAFLSSRRARDLVDRFVAFHGGTLTHWAPARISLVAIGGDWGGTHAEAVGRHLLLEIRPNDVPEKQAQVVFHELSHDLFARLSDDTRARWSSWFLSRGAPGALAWNLMRESLPTALGQGVAEARLARRHWRPNGPWYHIGAIDSYARAIYRTIDRAIDERRAFDEPMAASLIAVLEASPLAKAPPLACFGHAAFVAPESLAEAARTLAGRAPTRRAWLPMLGAPETETFLRRFGCVPLVAFGASLEDAKRLRAIEAAVPEYPAARFAEDPALRGVIVPGARASGALAIFLWVRPGGDAAPVVEALVDRSSYPDAPIDVR